MKVTNKNVRKFIRLTNKIKELERQREELRSSFIALDGGESTAFIVRIQRVLRETVCPRIDFERLFGADFLKQYNLLKYSEVNTVIVEPKNVLNIEGVA